MSPHDAPRGLRLGEALLTEIRLHAEAGYPHECCGLLLGTGDGAAKSVAAVRPATNEREDSPHNRYRIPAEEVFAGVRRAGRSGLEVVGFYHSHPDAPARPSETDRRHAWPWYSYVIVEVRSGRAGRARSWVVDDPDGAFVEEPIRVEPAPATGPAGARTAENSP